MRKPIIAGNWKMNKTPSEAQAFLVELKEQSLDASVEATVLVPAVDLFICKEQLDGTAITFGTQNMHEELSGAYTGELSAPMLVEAGCQYVVLGHSERREYFSEQDAKLAKKMRVALDHQLSPILCVGETLEEREAGEEEKKVQTQLQEDLREVKPEEYGDVVIAYEPIWAIGTGKTASADDAEKMCAFIREQIQEIAGEEAAQKVRIQYGGSVKPENVKEIMSKPNIDGALVGGASLKVDSFVALVNYQN